jgi:hypothetical protein
MKGLVSPITAAMVLAILSLSALPGLATKHKYIENFTTTQHKDALNTTARWDTVAGELRLYPFVPTLVGTYNTPGNAWCVAVSGDRAFVGDFSTGLQVIDISDPSSPTLVGTYNTPGNAYGVAVSGTHAFVADGSSGLQVIDISNPASPTLAGTCDTPGNCLAVTVSGDNAFVADGSFGLQVIDISDPASPTLVGTYNTSGSSQGIAVAGAHVFVADQAAGLQVIDITDPTTPTLVGTCDTPGSALCVSVSGDRAYVADYGSGLQVIDISGPTSPMIVGTCDTPGSAFGVTVSGTHAFVADASSGLQVIDISDPASPMLVGTYDTPGYTYGVTVSGDNAFVADNTSGLQVIAISDFVTPTLLGTYDTPSYACGVAVSGNRAFEADANWGLEVIDISDPANPTAVGGAATPGSALRIAISGDHAYIADNDYGLQVIDVSDLMNPVLVGTYNTPGWAWDVAVSGDYAYVADVFAGLAVIDVSDPTNPTLTGTCGTSSDVLGVAVSGNHAFVAESITGLQVIDVSDPATPTIVGTCNTPGSSSGVSVSGDYAYVADGSSGLQVIDVSDPTNPALMGTYNTPGNAYIVAVSGDYCFVADGESGLQVIDVSDPTNPTLVGTYDTPGSALGVTVSGEHAYVADHNAGLHVIQVFQSEVVSDNNVGRSLALGASNDTIFKARLVATQTDSVRWELSADGGVSWQGITPNGSWNQFAVPGADLLWRSTHAWAAPGVNPAVAHLGIDWLYETAVVDSIVDVPDDQGGWARVQFARSALDFADEAAFPISAYGVWRWVDSAALVAALEAQSSVAPEKSVAGNDRDFGDMPVIAYNGRTYVQSRPGLAVSSFPPGTWEFVYNVPAVQQDTYVAVVPTAADSSATGPNHTVFVLTAHTATPSIWYVSEPDSGYSVDNIAPAVPTGLAVAYNTGSGNALSWDPSPDRDFQYFNVYRSSDPGFVPSPSDLIHSTIATNWTDPDYDGWSVYYKITALDYVGNESAPASPGTVTAVEEPVLPQTYGLYQNVPNPFNPSTTIRYDVPAGGGAVTLRIYDASGRLVRTLQDGPQAAGQKTAVWNGRDDRGRGVVSGVYFYRLEAPGYRKTLKMILIQ